MVPVGHQYQYILVLCVSTSHYQYFLVLCVKPHHQYQCCCYVLNHITSINISTASNRITSIGIVSNLHQYQYYVSNYITVVALYSPLLPNNSVLIREVSFGEREHYLLPWYLLPRVCNF